MHTYIRKPTDLEHPQMEMKGNSHKNEREERGDVVSPPPPTARAKERNEGTLHTANIPFPPPSFGPDDPHP